MNFTDQNKGVIVDQIIKLFDPETRETKELFVNQLLEDRDFEEILFEHPLLKNSSPLKNCSKKNNYKELIEEKSNPKI